MKCKIKSYEVPLTFRVDENLVFPAALVATQAYSPLWWGSTEFIFKILAWLPKEDVEIPFEWCVIWWPLWYHLIFKGRSPCGTKHVTKALSPAFRGPSNWKGLITGATVSWTMKVMDNGGPNGRPDGLSN